MANFARMMLSAGVTGLLALSACQTTTAPTVSVAAAVPTTARGSTRGSTLANSPEAVYNDPCAARLHDLCGPLLEYYAIYKKLPARLEDLQSVADAGTKLDFTCPVSGQPYGYAPNGLVAVGFSKCIIAYDATPAHGGKRWCILWQPPRPGGSLSAEVLLVPEGTFHTYLRAEN